MNSMKKKIRLLLGGGHIYLNNNLLQALCLISGRMGKNHHICGRVVVDRNFMWYTPLPVMSVAVDNAGCTKPPLLILLHQII